MGKGSFAFVCFFIVALIIGYLANEGVHMPPKIGVWGPILAAFIGYIIGVTINYKPVKSKISNQEIRSYRKAKGKRGWCDKCGKKISEGSEGQALGLCEICYRMRKLDSSRTI